MKFISRLVQKISNYFIVRFANKVRRNRVSMNVSRLLQTRRLDSLEVVKTLPDKMIPMFFRNGRFYPTISNRRSKTVGKLSMKGPYLRLVTSQKNGRGYCFIFMDSKIVTSFDITNENHTVEFTCDVDFVISLFRSESSSLTW
jgi:hypothetical protein